MQVTPPRVRPSRASWRVDWHGNQPTESDKGAGRKAYMIFRKVMLPACMPAVLPCRRVGRISDRPGSPNKVAGVRRGQGRGRRGGKGTRGVVSLPSLYQSPNKGSVRYMRVQREGAVKSLRRAPRKKDPYLQPTENGTLWLLYQSLHYPDRQSW